VQVEQMLAEFEKDTADINSPLKLSQGLSVPSFKHQDHRHETLLRLAGAFGIGRFRFCLQSLGIASSKRRGSGNTDFLGIPYSLFRFKEEFRFPGNTTSQPGFDCSSIL